MPKPERSERAAPLTPEAEAADFAPVWDPLLRVCHWGLVLSFAVAWWTSRSGEALHQAAGYMAAGLVVLRIPWGFLGPRYSRFSQFIQGPRGTARYLAGMLRGHEARYLGHNPAGAAMIVLLLSGMAATALTGWMMTTDAYFGVSWVETAHAVAAYLMLALACLHVGGVLFASIRHRENLVLAMITGRKRAAAEQDVT